MGVIILFKQSYLVLCLFPSVVFSLAPCAMWYSNIQREGLMCDKEKRGGWNANSPTVLRRSPLCAHALQLPTSVIPSDMLAEGGC